MKDAEAFTFQQNEYVYAELEHNGHWDKYLVGPCERVGSAIWVCAGQMRAASGADTPAPGLIPLGEEGIDEIGLFLAGSYTMLYDCKPMLNVTKSADAPTLFLFRCKDDSSTLREKAEPFPQNQAGAPQL